MDLSSIKVEMGRFFRFGLVGICATIVYVMVSVVATELLLISPVPASILAQAAAFAVSYIGHSAYSFRVKTNHRVFLWRFIAITGLSFIVATGATWLITDVAQLSPRIGIATVAVLIPIVNFLSNRFWVFTPGLTPVTIIESASRPCVDGQ